MAPSEALAAAASQRLAATLRLDALSAADVDAGLALSDAAGWNQTGDDWAIFIGHGRAIGLRDARGRLVATAAALRYGGERAWISMVLVAEAWRHRGLASQLMDAAIEPLRAAGIVLVLDATPAGAAVYQRLGFVHGFEIDRWERRASGGGAANSASLPTTQGGASPSASTSALRPAGAADLDALVALDRAATGLDRRFLLESFLARPGTSAWLSADGGGFVVARAGRRATQVGPLAAPNAAAAIDQLDAVLAAVPDSGRAVFLDLPRERTEVAAWLEGRGFTRQRPFVRMALGAEAPALGAGSVVLAGPEFG